MTRRYSFVALGLAGALVLAASNAAAEPVAAPAAPPAASGLEPLPAPSAPSAPGAPAPKAARRGIAVVATAGASRDAAFSLARAVYASTQRPPQLDEPSARALAGEATAPDATPKVRELGELRGGLARDDAATRRLLGAIADATGVEALLVVGLEEAPSARLYLAESGELDAARYVPDVTGTFSWRGTLQSLERRFPKSRPAVATAAQPPPASLAPAPAAAVRPAEASSKPFYVSAWFWGSLGAAALFAGAFYLTARDTADDPIDVRMQIPR